MLSYFFPPKSTREILRENRRSIDRAKREITRTTSEIQREEKAALNLLKKRAKEGGDVNELKVMAREIAHKRALIIQMNASVMRLNAVQSQLLLMQANESIARAMMGASHAVAAINKQLKLPELNRALREFEKQTMLMEQSTENMQDVIDNVMTAPETNEESEDMVNQVLSEISLDVQNDLISAPANSPTFFTQNGPPSVQIEDHHNDRRS